MDANKIVVFFFFKVAMSSQLLSLMSAHDGVTVDQDLHVVLQWADQLEDFLWECSEKSLQTLLGSVHACIGSKSMSGRLNGLIMLQVLAKCSSDDVFGQHASSWIKMIATLVQKMPSNDNMARMSLSILRICTKRAPKFPDVSKYLTTLIPPTIEGVLKIGESISLANDCIQTVIVFYKRYPGSCKSSLNRVEKYLVDNIGKDQLEPAILGQCFSLMPILGGGGKDGIHHKANYLSLFEKLTMTLEDLLFDIFSMTMVNAGRKERVIEPLALPKIRGDMDLQQKALHSQRQYEMIAQCLCSLISMPCSFAKPTRLGLIFGVLQKSLSQSLSELHRKNTYESKVLLFVLPSVMKASMKILVTLLRICKLSMILFIPKIFGMLETTLMDLKTCQDDFALVKTEVFQLLSHLFVNFGPLSCITDNCKDVTACLLSEILPRNHDVGLLDKVPKRITSRKTKPVLQMHALKAINSLVQFSGSSMDETVYRQVQMAMICFGLEQECAKTRLPKETRYHLLQTLFTLLNHGHLKGQTSLPILAHLLTRSSQSDKFLQEICNHGTSICLQQMHPSRKSMFLDLPVDLKSISELKQELMKVHVYYQESSPQAYPSLQHQIELRSSNDPAIEKAPPSPDQQAISPAKSLRPKLKVPEAATQDLLKSLKRSAANANLEDDDLISLEESQEVVKDLFDSEAEAIVIPKRLKKAPRIEEGKSEDGVKENNAANAMDAETMLKDFVPVFK